MFLNFIRFLNTFSSALVMGAVFGVWLGFDPFSLSPTAYVEQQQNLISALNVLMPRLGFVTIIVTLINAFLNKRKKIKMTWLIVASLCFIAAGLITAFGNQVINAVVITWNPEKPPIGWMRYRDEWWTLHCYRTLVSVLGMTIVIWINTKTDTIP